MGAAVISRRKSAVVVPCLIVLAVALFVLLPAVALAASAQQQLTLEASLPTVTFGQHATLTVSGADPSAAVTLFQQRSTDTGFRELAVVDPAAGGTAAFTVRPVQTAQYYAQQGDQTTQTITVTVRPLVTLTATAPTPLLENQSVRYTVSVRPAHPGGSVQLMRWSDGSWEALRELKLGSDSRRSIRLPAGAAGKLAVRAEMAADAEHLAGHSLTWKRTVFDKSNPWGVPSKYAHLIVVSVHHYKLYYYEHGAVVRVFDCVTGRPSLPTPLGHFRIYAKDPHIGGPYGPYRMRYLGLFAIHGTDEPWLLGEYPRNFSHGCTRLSNAHISWLYPRVPVGTPVWNVP
jgi:hypothetical protein